VELLALQHKPHRIEILRPDFLPITLIVICRYRPSLSLSMSFDVATASLL